MKRLIQVLFLLHLLLVSKAFAYEKVELTLPSDNDILLTQFSDDSDRLIIWVPSEYGSRSELIETVLSISDAGFDLWMLNLHESYMVPPGKNSIDEFSVEDVYQLMQLAIQRGYKDIVLSSANRGAVLALKAGRLWQLKNPSKHEFIGYIFLHPHLIEGSVEIGEDAQYLPIARAVNKPVYILQPEYSTKYLRSDQVVEQLESGGASVKLEVLSDITAGFHARPKDEIADIDITMRQQMGEKYKLAYQFLKQSRQPDNAAKLAKKNNATAEQQVRLPSLYKFRGDIEPPKLQLKDMYGKPYDLNQYRGKVVLINFWASWCGPCVKEIPSLNRLVKKMQGKEFQLLTVDIKEPPDKILNFFKELKLQHNFPVLMDTDGQVSKDWKVYAYPSNFLLDKEGKVRYGYRGALEWDKDEVVKIINSLL
jgi:thiol-disulfide isomerase/thioredoxin